MWQCEKKYYPSTPMSQIFTMDVCFKIICFLPCKSLPSAYPRAFEMTVYDEFGQFAYRQTPASGLPH